MMMMVPPRALALVMRDLMTMTMRWDAIWRHLQSSLDTKLAHFEVIPKACATGQHSARHDNIAVLSLPSAARRRRVRGSDACSPFLIWHRHGHQRTGDPRSLNDIRYPNIQRLPLCRLKLFCLQAQISIAASRICALSAASSAQARF